MNKLSVLAAMLTIAITGLLLADEPPLPRLQLRGTVMDQEGRPVVGADVYRLNANSLDDSVLQQTRTGDDGAFAFDVTDDPELQYDGLVRPCVVAYKKDVGVGGMQGFKEFLAPDTRIALAPMEFVSVRVFDPEGRAVPAARIQPVYLGGGQDYIRVGNALAEQFAVTLDAEGRGSIGMLPSRPATTLQVDANHLGLQRHYLDDPRTSADIHLEPVGHLAGRVIADDPSAVANVEIQAGASRNWTRVRTDEHGRFDLGAVPAGETHVSVVSEPPGPFIPADSAKVTIEAGQKAEVQLQLVRAVSLVGRVIDEASEQPIAGARVRMQSRNAARLVTTNKQGTFQFRVLPEEKTSLSVSHVPGLYLTPSHNWRTETVSAAIDTYEVEPFRVKKGIAVAGHVRDEANQPVADARIIATWQHIDNGGRSFTIKWRGGFSSPDGTFVLGPVPPNVEIGIHAETNDRATEQMLRIGPSELQQPIAITVKQSASVVLQGQVTDHDGVPVPQARVRLRRSMQTPEGRTYRWSNVEFGGQADLITDARGQFTTPYAVPKDRQYVIIAEADGFLGYESSVRQLQSVEPQLTLEPIVLQRELLAVGRVLDRKGAAIEGARVWAPGLQPHQIQEVKTDEEGSFRLEHLHPDALFLFVEKDGYHMSGARVAAPGQEVHVRLDANGEPSAPLRLVVHTPEQQRQWLSNLIQPIFDELGKSDSDYFVMESLRRLLPHDREFVIGHLPRVKRELSRASLLIELGEIDDALAIGSQLPQPDDRSLLALSAASVAVDPARKRDLLADAFLHSRSIERPDNRVLRAAAVAESLWDLELHDEAKKIVDEVLPIASGLAAVERSAYARGKFAEILALVDSQACRKLIEPLTDVRETSRHRGNIAHELAAREPETAEQILSQVDERQFIIPYAVRVCYRMAGNDLPRAQRIADGLKEPQHQAYAYGAMAVALAANHADEAKRLYDKAYTILASQPHSTWRGERHFEVAFALLGHAEVVDPDGTGEYFWRTLSLLPSSTGTGLPDYRAQEERSRAAKLALLLALYGQFPEVQQQLVEPLFTTFESYTSRQSLDFYRENPVFMAMALCCPERACEWHARFFPKVAAEDRRLIPQPWMTLADVFGNSDQKLHQQIVENVFGLWMVDQED